MDPAILALESATAFTAALALLFARLDANHERLTERTEVREGLWKLALEISDWKAVAEKTDRTVQLWMRGKLTADKAIRILYDTAHLQIRLSESVNKALRDSKAVRKMIYGKKKPNYHQAERSLQNILRIYGPEVSDVLTEATFVRRFYIDELIVTLLNFGDEDQDAIQATITRLELATKELTRASRQLDDFVRDHFPPT